MIRPFKSIKLGWKHK